MSVNIKFDLNAPVQTNFLGNNVVYHGYAGMPDNAGRVYSDELCDIEADRAAELGVRITRTFYKWYSWIPETQTWDWETPECKAFYKWLQRMKDRNIKNALNTGWCLPGDIDNSGWVGNSPFALGKTWSEQVKKYAEWVSESLHQLIELRGFTNIEYILLFTEPQNSVWRYTKTPENKHIFELWKDCVKAVCEQLEADGRRQLVKTIGPNEGSTNTSVMTGWAAENADEYIDIYSSHDYQDFIPDDVSSKDSESPVIMKVAGSRIQQVVNIEPNTKYILKVKLEIKHADLRTTSGGMIIGAWDINLLSSVGIIEAGGQPTGRLNVGSTKMFDSAELGDGMQEICCSFESGDNDKCIIGIFRDIKEKETTVKLYYCTLTKENDDKNLISYPNLAKIPQGKLHDKKDSLQFIGSDWKEYLCLKNFVGEPYYYLKNCALTAMELIKKTGKPYWFDEYNVRSESGKYDDPLHGTRRAASMQSIMNAGVESSLMWTLFDQQWPNNHVYNQDAFVDGDHRYGVMPVLTRSLIPHPVYYAVGLVMKFMGGDPDTCIYAGEGENHLHATISKMPDGNFTLLVINNKKSPDAFAVDFGEELNLTLYRRLYDPATIKPDENAKQLAPDSSYEVGKILTDSLPAGGVAVYTTIK